MVVICPKCKIRLKINDAKIKPEGSRFKCPKCSTVLLVKKPAPVQKKTPDNNKVLVAHSNPHVANDIQALLSKNEYQTVTASDGIDAMVKIIKELPFLVIIEVSLPKIYGFEVCKRLKARPETENTKFILISSIYDKDRYKREPSSLYEADDYIEEHQIPDLLLKKITSITTKDRVEEKVKEPEQPPVQEEAVQKEMPQPPVTEKTETETEPSVEEVKKAEEIIERAKRLARTIVSDIFLYNTAKAEQSIQNDSFFNEFSSEIREGLKLYEHRIPQEIRSKGDFFHDTIKDFIDNKKKSL